MPVEDTLGSKIFELRKKHRLTQVQLGERVGVSGGAISQFEKEISRPTHTTLVKLCTALDYNFHELAEPRQLPATFPDSVEEGIDFITSLARQQSHADKSYDSELRHNGQVETRIELLLFNQREFTEFLIEEPHGLKNYAYKPYFLVNILALPSVIYTGSVVLEIQGSTMEPRYPDQSRYVISPVENHHWQYAIGVHAIWLKNEKFFFKRIKSNKNGTLLLHSDATGEQTSVELIDIASLWKAGQAIHLPPEEL